ncbi:hypothetical protein OCU04_002753 [Sclerotinia nivalis]|uniref:Uncharacterized protein n=1 Tax=Sclerotinia nivalis TaxID=352851 RepID=A0A9X0DMW9_9HELO|nr:hypothetical protein OCU04_002753 [Sclerotinia nivalis]
MLGSPFQVHTPTGEILPHKPQQLGKVLLRFRNTLYSWLLLIARCSLGPESRFSFGKKLSHYTRNNFDFVTITFSDDTSANGTLLISADDNHPHVKKQLLPCHNLLDTGGRVMFGKTRLSIELTDAFPGILQPMPLIHNPKASIPSLTLLEPIVSPSASSRPFHPESPKE